MVKLESLWISFPKIEKIRKFMEYIPKKNRNSNSKKLKDGGIFYCIENKLKGEVRCILKK